MNYYSPYFAYAPYAAPASRGLISNLVSGVRGINWSGFLSNAQKTLGIVNQALPMVKQVSPMINNAKTMFRVMNEFKKVDNNTKTKATNNETVSTNTNIETVNNESIDYSNQPTFFV